MNHAARSTSSRPYHAVRFYDDEKSLAKIVAEFLGDGLTDGTPGIVVATPAQGAAIVRELGARGLDVVSLKQSDDLVLLDAADTLSSFMANAKLDARAFNDSLCAVIARVCRGRTDRTVRIYGQMVDILWKEGKRDLAIRLEMLWNQLANTLSTVNDHYAAFPERRAAFRAYAREILNPVFAHVGWDADPGEPNNVTTLRENLIDKLGRFDDENVIAEARRRFEAFKKDPPSLPASIRRPTLQVVARKADRETYQTFRNLARSAISPLEKQQLYEVLATAEDPALASSSLEIAIGDEAQATTGLSMVRRVAMDNPDLAWRFALSHSDALDARLGPIERHGFYPLLAVASNNPDRLTDVRAFIDRTVPANARQSAERAYSELSFRLKVKADRLPEIDRWLAALKSR